MKHQELMSEGMAIVEMASKLEATINNQRTEDNEDSDIILVDGPVGLCEKCQGEKFDSEEMEDGDGNILGTEQICEKCGQRYHDCLSF